MRPASTLGPQFSLAAPMHSSPGADSVKKTSPIQLCHPERSEATAERSEGPAFPTSPKAYYPRLLSCYAPPFEPAASSHTVPVLSTGRNIVPEETRAHLKHSL